MKVSIKNRIAMTLLGALAMLCCLLSSCGMKERDKPSAPSFTSFWEGFDFANKEMIDNPGVTEAKFKDFCGVLSSSSPTYRTRQVDTLLSRSLRGSKEMFLCMMGLAEKHLLDANSPLRNEESYIPFLEYATKVATIDETYKERYRYQLENAKKNRVGTLASDFAYMTREGTRRTLKTTEGGNILLYFNNPDCHDCKRVFNVITSSASLAHLLASGELTLLAIYPDEDLTSWEKHRQDYPESWTVGRFKSQTEREKYNIPAIPCLYLLDKTRKVVLKDAPIEEVEAYLRKEFNI